MPVEEEMFAKDKYTIFDRKEKKYRKGIHSMFLFSMQRGLGAIAAILWETRLISGRATEMDESEPEIESSRVLRWYTLWW